MQFRTQRGNLLTLCERKTRFTLTAPLPSKKAETTNEALQETFGPLPSMARQSVTFDNGSEFALHENLNAELGTQTYFCDPHSPWQRGTIENTNGLFRRDMPRKTNLHDYSARDIDELTWAINSTPRKCLGFKTPAEAFLEIQVLHLICESSPPGHIDTKTGFLCRNVKTRQTDPSCFCRCT